MDSLFPVEPSPAKPRRTSAEVAAFCETHGILTHDAGHDFDPQEMRWMACKVPPKRLDNGEDITGMTLPEMVAYFGRLLDEAGLTEFGATKREAVRILCTKLNLQCDL